MSEFKPNVNKIDGVNYVKRTIPIGNQEVEVEGITARALIKALQGIDPDDCVIYLAEMTPELADAQLLIGIIGGIAGKSPRGVCFLMGPEVNNELNRRGLI